MKVTLANFLSDLRGKDVGVVFTKNRGGPVLKQYVTTTNPNTARQIAARNNFASAARGWGAITAAARENFNSFASSGYSPLNPKSTTSGWTGRQAFTALQQSVLAGNAKLAEADFTLVVAFPTTDRFNADGAYTLPIDAPSAFAPDGKIYVNGTTNSALITGVTYGGDNTQVEVIFACNALTIATAAASAMGIGSPGGGIKVYASEKVGAEGYSISSPYMTLVGTLAPGTTINANVADTGATSFKVIMDNNGNNFFEAGWHYMTVVYTDVNGQQVVAFQGWKNFVQG